LSNSSIFAVSVLLTAIASLVLALFVYSKGRDKALNRSLALFSLALAVWTMAQGIGVLVGQKTAVLFWTRVQVGAAIFLPLFFLEFIFSLLNLRREKSRVLRLSRVIAVSLVVLDFTPLFVGDIVLQGFKYYPRLTFVYGFFAFWLIASFIYGFCYLVADLRRSAGDQYQKLLYVFVASLIGFLGGGTSFFPIFNINLPVVSHFTLPVYEAVAVYAIVKHKLLDITVYVRKGLVYSFITAIFTTFYVALLSLINNYFQDFGHINSIIATVGIVFCMCFVFQPLRDWSQSVIDNLFFKSLYDYQDIVKKFSQGISAMRRVEELEEFVKRKFENIFKVSNAQICLDDTLPKFNPFLIIPIESKGRRWGNLFLGHRLSGDDYNAEDKNLLETLAHQIAVALENIQLYQTLARSENLAALGTLVAGMAHEIKNPLAAVKGMTQVLPENLADPDFMASYTELVPRQLDRINGIVENLLKVGRAPKLTRRPVDINQLLQEVIDSHENLCRQQNITIYHKLEVLPVIEADADQLYQVFVNLALNAIQAMPEGGRLEFYSRVSADGKQVVVEVVDTGVGIAPEKLGKIFDPFFTLKETGTGLGLFMAIRVIQEHDGTIEVKSPVEGVGRGTSFSVILPIK
jgi:signal transduction histidine kinase